MVMGLVGLGIKYYCAGEDQKQFTLRHDLAISASEKFLFSLETVALRAEGKWERDAEENM
jgi:hypothetical protein